MVDLLEKVNCLLVLRALRQLNLIEPHWCRSGVFIV